MWACAGPGLTRGLLPWDACSPGTAGGCVVVAQSMYCLSVYVPMPPPPGDTFGLERWQGAAAPHQRGQPSSDEPAHRPASSAETGSAPAAAGTTRQRRNVLIIGDSLVVGIGCRDTMVLPQGICRQISDLLQVDISWRAVGVNGGDVRTIHQEVLDTVRRFQRDREVRYREYMEGLGAEVAGGAAGADGAAAGAKASPDAGIPADPVLVLASNAQRSQQLLQHHLQQTPPHLPGAGAALFDFVRTHYHLKLAERGGLGGGGGLAGGDAWGAQGDMVYSAGGVAREATPSGSEPSPRVDAVVVLCGLNDLKRILNGRTSTVFRADLDKLVTELRTGAHTLSPARAHTLSLAPHTPLRHLAT